MINEKVLQKNQEFELVKLSIHNFLLLFSAINGHQWTLNKWLHSYLGHSKCIKNHSASYSGHLAACRFVQNNKGLPIHSKLFYCFYITVLHTYIGLISLCYIFSGQQVSSQMATYLSKWNVESYSGAYWSVRLVTCNFLLLVSSNEENTRRQLAVCLDLYLLEGD